MGRHLSSLLSIQAQERGSALSPQAGLDSVQFPALSSPPSPPFSSFLGFGGGKDPPKVEAASGEGASCC